MIVRKPRCIGLVGRNLHLYVFSPSAAYGNYSGYGFHLRCRTGRSWRHLLARLHCKGKANRRARIYEICSWRSRNATSNRGKHPGQRLGFKSYLRIKVSPGGTPKSEPPQ